MIFWKPKRKSERTASLDIESNLYKTSDELKEAFIEKARTLGKLEGLWGIALTRKATYLPVISLEKTDAGLEMLLRVSSQGIAHSNSSIPDIDLKLIDSRIINGGTSLQESSYTWVAPEDLASAASISWELWHKIVEGSELPDVEVFQF